MDCDGTEEEIDEMMDALEFSVLDPEVSDLIFHPDGKELTAEEVVDKALAYKPIIL